MPNILILNIQLLKLIKLLFQILLWGKENDLKRNEKKIFFFLNLFFRAMENWGVSE
jgi:hypothetical protein